MVPQAQNALLKTLEEPPSASVFLLVSSMPDALLPTVRSRCPRLRFAALPVADVATVLDARSQVRRRGRARGRGRGRWQRGRRAGGQLHRRGRGPRDGGAAAGAGGARRRPVAPHRRGQDADAGQAVAARSGARAAGGLPAGDVVAAARPVDHRLAASTPAPWPTRTWPTTWTRWRAPTTPGAACAPTRPSIRRWPRWSATPARRSWPIGWRWSCETARRDDGRRSGRHRARDRAEGGRRSARARGVRAGALRARERMRLRPASCRPTRAGRPTMRSAPRCATRRPASCRPWPPRR